MTVNWQAIFDGVAGNFVWFIIGLGAAIVWRLLRTRFLGRAILGWRFGLPFTVVIGSPFGIEPGTTSLSRATGLPIFGFGPLNALHSVWNLLAGAFRGSRSVTPLVTSRTFNTQSYSDSLVSIGYPLGNPVTLTLLDNLDDLPITFDEHRVLDASSGAALYETKYVNGETVYDYGIIVLAPNPFNENAQIIVLAGTETFGVKAAADLLTYNYIRTLYGGPRWIPRWIIVLLAFWLSRGTRNRKVIVVSCAVNGLYVSPPKVELVIKF